MRKFKYKNEIDPVSNFEIYTKLPLALKYISYFNLPDKMKIDRVDQDFAMCNILTLSPYDPAKHCRNLYIQLN